MELLRRVRPGAPGRRVTVRAAAGPADDLPTGDAKRERVRAMFERIAPRYDLMNRLMTGGLDRRWRHRAMACIGPGPGERVLDLACGTGDLAALAAARGARVVGVDFTVAMLRRARARLPEAALVRADAARLPFTDGSVDAAVCGFALRNLVEREPVLRELRRVLRPGGRVALLDAGRPRNPLLRRAHGLVLDGVVPRLGSWLSDREAYRYLPRSTAYLPDPGAVTRELEGAGFAATGFEVLALGAAWMWWGRRP